MMLANDIVVLWLRIITMEVRMSTTTLRLPIELKNFICETAKDMGISANALVLSVLWHWKDDKAEHER